MSIIWTIKEKTLLESIRPVLSTREINEVFNLLGYSRSLEAIRKQSKRMGVEFTDFGHPATIDLRPEEKKAIDAILETRETTIKQIVLPVVESPSAKSKKTCARREIMTDLLDALIDVRKEVQHTSSMSLKKATASGKKSLVVLLSDWHMCQIVTDTESRLVTYDTEIATQRIIATPGKILNNFTEEQAKQIDEVVILLAGDMISGEGIFPHHEMYIHEHAVEQTTRATKLIWSLIKKFRSLFPLVRVVTTKGNHGRTGASPEANWDNMIYQMIELLADVDSDTGITVKNRYGNFGIVDIRGWKGLIRHQAPAQADTAGAIAKFASWKDIHKADFYAFGHWHHWGVFTVLGQPAFRNGSLVGGDDYSETLAKNDEPTQLCWLTSEENICEAIYPIRYTEE